MGIVVSGLDRSVIGGCCWQRAEGSLTPGVLAVSLACVELLADRQDLMQLLGGMYGAGGDRGGTER
jgi:hypothetical protein